MSQAVTDSDGPNPNRGAGMSQGKTKQTKCKSHAPSMKVVWPRCASALGASVALPTSGVCSAFGERLRHARSPYASAHAAVLAQNHDVVGLDVAVAKKGVPTVDG